MLLTIPSSALSLIKPVPAGGKFKPYLVAFAIPGTIGTCIYWLMPYFFNDDPMNMAKFGFWLVLSMIREAAGTFRSIAETGMLATITPHPVDRTRLITKAEFFSGYMGEKLPEIAMGLLIDFVNHEVISTPMKGVYLGMGCFCAVFGGAMALFFFITTRERVVQSVDRPSIRDGIKSILTNKPILLITLSDFLGAFSLSAGLNNYYIDVLGSASIKNIVGIPGAFTVNLSYAYIPWARRKFSTKLLWIVGGSWGDFLMMIVFFIGSIGGIGPNGWYNKKSIMIPAFMAQETIFVLIFGIRRVIPREMFNEAMDYCEWKNGFRTEGMTSVAKGLATKLVSTIANTIKPLIMSYFGYNVQAGFGKQTDRAKYGLFMMGTLLPFATGILSIIPKLFYDLTGKKREIMYEELLARRAQTQSILSKDEGNLAAEG